uniref:SMAX1-like nucleotide binding domain-containing protein n=1 Tax=Leersia perrieri TaxID=77586 RepID=A0A0D9VLZ7_9ORYZ
MREASFSSTAVKSAMLRSLSDPDSAAAGGVHVSAAAASVLHHHRNQFRNQITHREEEVNKVIQVLKRGHKRNPVLVGDTADVDAVVQDVMTMIHRQRMGNARVISFQREFGEMVDLDRGELVTKIKQLGEAIRSDCGGTAAAGVVVNLGNLQWLVEERRVAVAGGEEVEKRRGFVLDTARAAVAEMARVMREYGGAGEDQRVWVFGTATCATYLKCQVYHPALESEWDLQAVPITPRPPPPPPPSLGLSPSVNRGILSSSVEVLSSAMTTTTARPSPSPSPSMCNACLDGYERDRAEMMSASSAAVHAAEQPPMSQWLQIATPSSAARPLQDMAREADELRRRWFDRCAHLHSHGGVRPAAMVTCSEWNGASVLSNMRSASAIRPPTVAVDTDLALGPAARSAPPCRDTDEKLLTKRLTEAVRWQPEAAAAVAVTIAKAKSGEGNKRRRGGDTWVIFSGNDVAGKAKMADALSMSVFGTNAVTVRLGGGRSTAAIADAVRANPSRVIVLDGLDQHVDDVTHASILRAVESGRLVDTHGRDVTLAGAIFVIMTSSSSPSPDEITTRCGDEVTVTPFADDHSPWNLELRVRNCFTQNKRRPPLLVGDDHRRVKPRPLHLDLNLSTCDEHHTDVDDDDSGGEESRNSSSDLTVENEHEYGQPPPPSTAGAAAEKFSDQLIKAVDGRIVFKPVDFGPLKRSVSDVMSAKFGDFVAGGEMERLAGAAATSSLEAWADEVLCPTIRHLKRSLSANDVDGSTTVSLSAVEGGGGRRMDGEVFPTSVTVAVDGNY